MAIVIGPTSWIAAEKDAYIRIAACCTCGTQVADGSSLICKTGGVAFFVAPSAAQVTRNFYCRADAVTVAQSCTGRTGWFVPTCGQLITGYNCRQYWNSYGNGFHWSNTCNCNTDAWGVNFSNGSVNNVISAGWNGADFVRAFRCVTY